MLLKVQSLIQNSIQSVCSEAENRAIAVVVYVCHFVKHLGLISREGMRLLFIEKLKTSASFSCRNWRWTDSGVHSVPVADNIMDQNMGHCVTVCMPVLWWHHCNYVYMYTCIIVFMLHYLQYNICCSSCDILPGDLSGWSARCPSTCPYHHQRQVRPVCVVGVDVTVTLHAYMCLYVWHRECVHVWAVILIIAY